MLKIKRTRIRKIRRRKLAPAIELLVAVAENLDYALVQMDDEEVSRAIEWAFLSAIRGKIEDEEYRYLKSVVQGNSDEKFRKALLRFG